MRQRLLILNLLFSCYRTRVRENAQALKQEEFQPELETIAEFLALERGRTLSPVLQTRIVVGLIEAAELLHAKSDTFMFAVYGFVADELLEFGDPLALSFYFKQYQYSVKARAGDDLSASHSPMLPNIMSAGVSALHTAAELCETLYGEGHEKTINFRNIAGGAIRMGASAV